MKSTDKILKILIRSSLRTRLIMSFVLIVVCGGTLSSLVGTKMVADTIIKQAQHKVLNDLNSAWMVYNNRLKEIEISLHHTAREYLILDGIKKNRFDLIQRELEEIRILNRMDILTLTDRYGIVVARSRAPYISGDDQSSDIMVNRALRKRESVSGTDIISQHQLRLEGEELVERAFISFIPTPHAKPRAKDRETSGMILKAAVPILDEIGNPLGALYGGRLLNRNFDLVDKIKDIVYRGEMYQDKEIGTATIFQWDVRIATNLRNKNGTRATGTRLSAEVYDRVLENGMSYVDEAFVVNDHYLTAYDPIRNVNNEVIGALYVGILMKPYTDLRNEVILSFFGLALLSLLMVLLFSYYVTNRIIHPLREMVVATDKIAHGDLEHEVPVKSNDEIGYLARSFNKMIDAIELSRANLLQRTQDLEVANAELQETQNHLIRSEKLASLGKMAAGIAHEINNPLTGVITFSHLLMRRFHEQEDVRHDIEIILRESTRCAGIVRGLLDFARQTPPQKKRVNINEVIHKSLAIVEYQSIFHNIKVQLELDENLPLIMIDASQIQQVFMNIILNAVEAMEGKGLLTLQSRQAPENNHLEISFADTGAGIAPESLAHIFDPFFTTKEPNKGTGLGLAVSYGIIRRHQGDILVESKLGEGTKFTIILPCSPDEEGPAVAYEATVVE